MATPLKDFVRTKVVATVGPASSDVPMLEDLIRDGVNVFRINMAHGSREEHQSVLNNIRNASSNTGIQVASLVDLAGPKIRLGMLVREPIECRQGDEFEFIRGTESSEENQLTANYDRLIDDVSQGDQILLADGIVRLVVFDKTQDSAKCKVVDSGPIRSRQGISLPGVHLSMNALTNKDRDNAEWAAKQKVEFISLSFVSQPQELFDLRELVEKHHSNAMLVAKIEKREALTNLDEIIDATDVIMVARGDLGVEIDLEQTPIAQKDIISRCQHAHVPVIVATQMLESMHQSKRPTRAEVSDVANAILDGADACMLSGETAIGEHPREAVQMMRKIMKKTESVLSDMPPVLFMNEEERITTTAAVVDGAANVATNLEAKLIVIAGNSTNAVRIKSKLRDAVPTISISSNSTIARQTALFWGVIPLEVADANIKDHLHLQTTVEQYAKSELGLQTGDFVVFVIDTDILPNMYDIISVRKLR